MNWGYPRTVEGFWHAVSRGQYEKISPVDNLKDALTKNPTKYPRLLLKIIFEPGEGLHLGGGPVHLLFALPARAAHSLLRGPHEPQGAGLVADIRHRLRLPDLRLHHLPVPDAGCAAPLFIGRVQYIQAHAILAVWISYGLIFALAWIDTRTSAATPRSNSPAPPSSPCCPLVPVGINAYDEIHQPGGRLEQNSHDFGWQFGAWQLEGARAILHDIGEEAKSAYPNPAYPPPMDTNAVFFGGTDPGRFVPTYMIYSAHFREDVYLITQNALADNTYMNVMRDLYGDRIWIPSQQDSNFAFQKYVQDVQSGRSPPAPRSASRAAGSACRAWQGVMMINGILARMIFEANKLQHASTSRRATSSPGCTST
jgi:hypothetical protein